MQFIKLDDSKIAAKLLLKEIGSKPSDGLSWTDSDSVLWQNYCKAHRGVIQVVPDYNRQPVGIRSEMSRVFNANSGTSAIAGTDLAPKTQVVTKEHEKAPEPAAVKDEQDIDDLTYEELEELTK